jgi:hypothetical protein
MAQAKKPTGKPDQRLSWLLLGIGLIVFGLGAWAAVNGARTLKWPRVAAEIVDAKLTLHERETRDVQRPDRWHTFAVHYLYRINGKTYLGGATEPYDFNMQNSAGAKKMAETYRIGSKVQVDYDPNDASVAYLMPGPSSFSLVLLGIGVAFVLIGLLARRMIRVGPGADDDDEPDNKKPKAAPKRVALDPKIADYYSKPPTAQPLA